MKLRSVITLIYFAAIPSIASSSVSYPLARKGVLDLRYLKAEQKFVLKLNGEWEFYWGKLLHPFDFKDSANKILPDFGSVPSYWTSYDQLTVRPSKTGFATYRLTILLPHGFREPLGFDMPVFDSSYDIYVNGKYMAGNGIPGKSREETSPWYEKNFFRYDPDSDSVVVLINVSNFDHRRGGFWLPVRTGTFTEVRKKTAASWAADWATISLLLGFSLFFLFFFITYPKDRLIGSFSLAAIGMALRPLFTSNFLILNIVNISWKWLLRCEYLDLYIILTGWFWFFATLYPSKFFKPIAWASTIIFSLSAVLTLFLPVRIFSYSTYLYYPSLVLLIGYALTQNIKGIIRKNVLDYIYFSAFILLSYAAIHDVGISLGRSERLSGYILTYALVLFVFIQAVLLLYKWVKAYSEKEKLQGELEYVNRNLEEMVNDRTQEIYKRKEEIENQNVRIELQNKQLSDTIQLKNKIFSVIAHDLRSPVVNILYMLNLLKDEEYRDKFDAFANASIQYSQQVITLLENMLVWGRGQEDKIKFSPERRDLADIILTNLSIFKESADKKDISVNFTQIGNSKAYFDKDLLDIIIRNLLSNAVKYTPRSGRISILLKDKSLSGEGIVLKVCDNGIGIPPEKQEYLFSSREVESTPGTENEKGTGIGLKLCWELVKMNNGQIAVDSKVGEGTCFSITLPENKNT
ncbi:MAG: sensor histidine kinase [Bacteroidales bacterium]